MFPKELDGAKVLYYTDKQDFGTVLYSDGTVADHVCYLAICAYEGHTGYYLFLCDVHQEVIADDLWDTIEQCKAVARNRINDIVWHE